MGISNFHSCTPFEGYSLQCPRQLDTFIFKELKFDAALLVQHSYTPRMRSTQPVSPAAHLTAPPTAALDQPPLFPTRWSCTSCGPRFGVTHPAGHDLVLRILRSAAGFCISAELLLLSIGAC